MDVDGFLSAIVVGLVIGALGRLLVPGRQRIGCVLTIVVGILAALLGSLLSGAVGIDTDGFSWSELGVQVLVAAFGVAVLSGLTRSRPR